MNNFKYEMFRMMKRSFNIVCAGLLLTSAHPLMAHDNHNCHHRNRLTLPRGHCEGPCAAEVREMIRENPAYHTLFKTLNPFIPQLTQLTFNARSQATYEPLLALCNQIAAKLPTGRVVVCDSDGLVAVDTALGALNTFANYQAGAAPSTFANAINVNHNSRISILDAQLWVCGLGVETKFSNTVEVRQQYVAIRLGRVGEQLKNNKGAYLNNEGTARISVNEGVIK